MKKSAIIFPIATLLALLYFRVIEPKQKERARAAEREAAAKVEAAKVERAAPATKAARVLLAKPAARRDPASAANIAGAANTANTAGAANTAHAPDAAPVKEPLRLAEVKGLNDKRGASPDGARELEALNYGMETLDEDIEACLEQWSASSSTISGRATIAFQLAPDGLTSAWLEGGEQIPFGPRTCIANAVYGIDWSRIVDKPAEITRNFERGAEQ